MAWPYQTGMWVHLWAADEELIATFLTAPRGSSRGSIQESVFALKSKF